MTLHPCTALLALALIACSPPPGDAHGSTGETPAPPAAATEAPAFGATDLTALIAADGAEATLAALMAQPEDPRWQATLSGISGGDLAWIAAAAPLVSVFDGEAAESGFAAYGDALAHQPAAVLAAVGPDGLESTCQPYPPEATQAKETALGTIPDESPVLALRDECLIYLSGEPT